MDAAACSPGACALFLPGSCVAVLPECLREGGWVPGPGGDGAWAALPAWTSGSDGEEGKLVCKGEELRGWAKRCNGGLGPGQGGWGRDGKGSLPTVGHAEMWGQS